MEYFEEAPEHWSSVNPQRCCSYCNTAFRLDDYIDSAKYYTYKECGPRPTSIHKAIILDIKDWATTQAAQLPRHFIFIPTAGIFLLETLYEPIARLTDFLCTANQLKSTVGTWHYWNSHGEQLLTMLKKSSQKHRSNIKHTPSQAINQSSMLPPSNSSQYQSQYDTQISTDSSLLTMLPPSTPSQGNSQLTLYNTPSQIEYTPLPELSVSSQATDIEFFNPPTPATPMPSAIGVKRRKPLQEMSGNIRTMRPRLSKTLHKFVIPPKQSI
jgi:hypothetical protein